MRMMWLAACRVGVLAVPLVVAGAVSGIAPGSAAARSGQAGVAGPSAAVSFSGTLNGVAATSARNAWAVGSTNTLEPLILRWNGTAWKQVPSPSLTDGQLFGAFSEAAS